MHEQNARSEYSNLYLNLCLCKTHKTYGDQWASQTMRTYCPISLMNDKGLQVVAWYKS